MSFVGIFRQALAEMITQLGQCSVSVKNLRMNQQKVALCEPQERHTARASRWNDSTKASTRAGAKDAHPKSDLQTNAGGVGALPEPGLADAPRDTDVGLQGSQYCLPARSS